MSAKRTLNYTSTAPRQSTLKVEWYKKRDKIVDASGHEVYHFISRHVDIHRPDTIISLNKLEDPYLEHDNLHSIITLSRVNDIRRINKYFEGVNEKLEAKGILICCAETKDLRKKRILKKYAPGINYIMYSLDFIVKRIFPKFSLTKKLYFLLTRGNNRVLSRAETLGRLYSCGFEVLEEKTIQGKLYVAAQKTRAPYYDSHPTYGPLVRLKRIGKDGKIIKVYKLRTMHPYAEYLQEYVFNQNHLCRGGKFNNDFRVTTLGKFARSCWIDELPMLINFFRGEIKLFGVRPLSKQYYQLYPEILQKLRTRFKPGLIPPYYADLPSSLEEIIQSELNYLLKFRQYPLKTQFIYFWRALYNILVKRARSA
jgi:hypothetical protein